MRRAGIILALATGGAILAFAAQPGAARQTAVTKLTSLAQCGAVDVNFDNLDPATHVAEQYASQGVHFLDDEATTPLTYANSEERTTSSPPNSLANDADYPGTSSGVPLTISFTSAQQKVGFYLGNGTTDGTPTATLEAFDAAGATLGSVSSRVTANDLTQFLGLDAGANVIRSVRLDYGDTLRSEEIDDLCFETLKAPPPVEPIFSRTLLYRAPLLTFEPRIVFLQDYSLHGIEVTQAIQCFNTAAGLSGCADNSLPVALDKTTTARLYLKYFSAFATQANNIPVRFWYRVVGQPWAHVDLTGTAKNTLSQLNAGDSANVFFSVFGGNTVNTEFYAEVDPNNTLSESNEANNRYPASGVISMSFQRRTAFKVTGRKIHYHPSGYGGTQDPAGWAITGGAASWWNQLLPLKNNAVNYALASGSKDFTTSLSTAAGEHALIQSLNTDWVVDQILGLFLGGATPLFGARHVYGWMPNAGYTGGHADMPIYPHAGGLGIVGIGTDAAGTSTDSPGKGAIVFGHELTHDYDVKHTNTGDACGSSDTTTDFPYTSSSIQEVGFNTLTGAIYNPANTHDLMSYCPPGSKSGWIAPFTWNKMFNKLAPSSSFSFTRAFQGSESLVVDATLFRSGGGRLEPLHRLPIASLFPPVAASAYAIELRGSEGSVLAHVPFAADFESEYSSGPFVALIPQAGQSFTIPFAQGTQEVVLLHGDEVLDRRAVSANAPTVHITSATPRLLEWTASDPDGDAIASYAVEFSHDAGESWQLIANGLTSTSLVLDPDTLAGSPDTRFRVIATDGVNTGISDESDPVAIPNKPPMLEIADPADGTRVPAGSLVVLFATATDLEDGSLDDSAFQWSNGATGAITPVTLTTPGQHTFTVTATDSNGAASSKTVHVLVGAVDTPAVAPAAPQVGQTVVASAHALGAGAGAACTVDYGDGSGELAGTFAGGTCTGPSHAYLSAGEFPVVVTVEDNAGEVGTGAAHVTVGAATPTGGFVTGGGFILVGNEKLHFQLSVRYAKNATTPSGLFKAGGLASPSLEWLTVSGDTARMFGRGTLDGRPVEFLVEATDGGKDDAFRIRAWRPVTGAPVFEAGGPLAGGSIQTH